MLPGASGYEKQRVGALMKLALSHRKVVNAERKYPLANVCVYHFFPSGLKTVDAPLSCTFSQSITAAKSVTHWHPDFIALSSHRSDETRHRTKKGGGGTTTYLNS